MEKSIHLLVETVQIKIQIKIKKVAGSQLRANASKIKTLKATVIPNLICPRYR